MNKEIKQLFQKISAEDILSRKFYPVWFFTNERLEKFLFEIKDKDKVRNIFSIAGGGDFAFNCLPLFDNLSEINVCDARQLANITVDLKIALIKKLLLEEILAVFGNSKINNKNDIYSRIKGEITFETKIILNRVLKNCHRINFLDCAKKSGYWYKYSFWQVKNKGNYTPYLNVKEYKLLRERINKINIYCGDFEENLKLFSDNFYDLIYVSNIFDSKKFCDTRISYLKTIREKLAEGGRLLVVVQNNPKKIIKDIERQGFKIYQKEIHKFNIITSILGHYCYSFLLFKKANAY